MTGGSEEAIDVHSIEAEGVRLRARIQGAGESARVPLVVLHGFTGSVESMAATATALAVERMVVSIDMVGHGQSESPEELIHYIMERCVAQLVSLLDQLGIQRAHWLGYSMGGRVALSVAAAYPERMVSAVLVGASAGLPDPEARRQRMHEDEQLARRILEGGIEPFVREWMAKPLFASQRRLGEKALADARAQRLRNSADGLAKSLRGMGTGAMEPIVTSLVEVPLCFVAGAEDEKFSAISRDLAERFPNARVEIVEQAGHAVHLESPRIFHGIVMRYFELVEASASEAR